MKKVFCAVYLLSTFLICPTVLVGSEISESTITPSDTYPYIQGIVSDLKLIRSISKFNANVDSCPVYDSKSPTDVYLLAYVLLADIKLVSNNTAAMPDMKSGRKVPADVMDILELVREEVSIIKRASNITAPDTNFQHTPGKLPHDVYHEVCKAIALVAAWN